MLVESKPFTQASFYAVSLDRVPKSLLHHQSQAMLLESVVCIIDPEMGGAGASSNIFHAPVFYGLSQSFVRAIAT